MQRMVAETTTAAARSSVLLRGFYITATVDQATDSLPTIILVKVCTH